MPQKFEVFKTFFGLIFKMKSDFVNFEESVREPFVPNLPGVQPSRLLLFYFDGGWVEGGGHTFWFFKSNEIYIYCSLDIYLTGHKRNLCTNILMGFKIRCQVGELHK